MPSEAEADNLAMRAAKDIAPARKRTRPRWYRWLLWGAVRVLLVAGVGAGVGTVPWRPRPPDLMHTARRIASLVGMSGYYWTPKGELRLYRHQRNGTVSLRWNENSQSATFAEILTQSSANPMHSLTLHAQTVSGAGQQFQRVEAYQKSQPYTPGKPLPLSDYNWKIKPLPNMQSGFEEVALSPDGKRVAFKCLMPRTDWRDRIMQRVRRGYKTPFRGQGAAILISNVDGSRTDILGVVNDDMPAPKSPYSRSGESYSLQGVFWRPDGKHLSFAYGDGVYEVFVP